MMMSHLSFKNFCPSLRWPVITSSSVLFLPEIRARVTTIQRCIMWYHTDNEKVHYPFCTFLPMFCYFGMFHYLGHTLPILHYFAHVELLCPYCTNPLSIMLFDSYGAKQDPGVQKLEGLKRYTRRHTGESLTFNNLKIFPSKCSGCLNSFQARRLVSQPQLQTVTTSFIRSFTPIFLQFCLHNKKSVAAMKSFSLHYVDWKTVIWLSHSLVSHYNLKCVYIWLNDREAWFIHFNT